MATMSFDKVSFLYDFVENHIFKDYPGSLDIIDAYLPLDKDDKIIDIGGGTGFISKAIFKKIKRLALGLDAETKEAVEEYVGKLKKDHLKKFKKSLQDMKEYIGRRGPPKRPTPPPSM